MKFRDMSALLPEKEKVQKEKATPSRNISRLSQPKPIPRQQTHSSKNFPETQLMNLGEQEKCNENSSWSRAALHAHYCCVSQRHPAFVHLTELLIRNQPLKRERVHLWKMQEFLVIARRLERFITDELRDKPRRKRAFSSAAKELPTEETQKELWDEYLESRDKRLFQVPKSSL